MGETTTGEVTRVIRHDDYYGYSFPVPSRFRNDLMADDTEKWSTLATIGIGRRHEEDTPLRAWRDAVAVASGLPAGYFQLENGGHALDLGFTPSYVRAFAFYLA